MKTLLQPLFVPGKRKYLFLGDEEGMKRLSPVIQKVIKDEYPNQSVLLDEREETDISRWLEGQKMGSFLYISMEWNKLFYFKKMAEAHGFSSEETQYIGHGVRFIHVFCSKCHQKMEVNGEPIDQITTCPHCHLKLSVSTHFSPLHEAYLGYAAPDRAGSDQ
ncbi:hypothetical protein [Bacillus sp. es.034]|uniref:hypothetical protein n=1 Tax=Bacillus sp. es.034 TaxID=1761763 RepID=UPI000BF69D49|nr:hypothetical protein [Bacillus sp. es.034]PFG07396.1 hypothetical protein ATG71_4293 [Bacillus sp. es.034]